MSKERIEISPATYVNHRRRLVCSSKEDGHRHNRGCYQKIRRGRRSRRHLRVSSYESNYIGNLLKFSGDRMSRIPESSVKAESLASGLPGNEIDLSGEMKRRGSRRFKRVVPFRPRVLPYPIKLPKEGDFPVEPVRLPVRRKAA